MRWHTFSPRLKTTIIVALAVVIATGIITRVLIPRQRTLSNVAYCSTTSKQQTLDVYTAHSSRDKIPYVVYIHGGGWRGGDKVNALTRAYVPFFLSRGVSFISVNYRLSPQATYPSQNEDVACALTYIDSHASQLRLDTSKSILFGDSAGGELAAFAALTIPYKSYDYEAPTGVIDFYGVSDFNSIINATHPDKNARFYLGSKYNQLATSASPSSYITAKAPRFLFIHGLNDKVVPLSQTTSIDMSLKSLGVDTELVTLKGLGHGFAGPELKPQQYNQIKDAIDSFVKETISP